MTETNPLKVAFAQDKTAVQADINAAKTEVATVVAKQESWVRANRKALIIGAAVVIALVLAVHFL